ncbi:MULTISPECIES: nitroreductase family protein [unclassified Xanthobacter]|uniref:nitroreductase family protein n=1 Tax=unclassified Xanthobacter TaxID=2623496 RepID=UPI001F239A77|nr:MULTISPECIES: nitroreductase family protein [unclassified Xanthobacter]
MAIAVTPRQAEHPIDPLFLDRWSPRAFTGEEIPQGELNAVFEAARWAPSSFNSQPWRCLYARRGTPEFETFLGLLIPYNQQWAKNAAVLIIALSARTFVRPGTTEAQPARNHSFDTGAAWASLALQATKLGWHAHGIGGFDVERTRRELKVPDDYEIEAAIAIGRHGDKSILPESFHKGESPNGRRPITETAFEGAFPKA